MTTQKKELYPIDPNLYRFNIMYQLRQVESNRALLYKENEKQVLTTLLKTCKDVDGNKLCPIMDKIFNRSLQPVPPKATVMIDSASNTKITKEATVLTCEATTLPNEAMPMTSEAPNTSITKDVAQVGDTGANHKQNIDGKQKETYANNIERQLYDPKMSNVSVRIKQRRFPTTQAVIPHRAVLEQEHSIIEKPTHQKIQLRDVENDASTSPHEKRQFKAILMSIKEIDGNISYPIFQEIFQRSSGYRTANDPEPLVSYTQTIEQEVLDTAITESGIVVPESHQTHASPKGQISSTESISRVTNIHLVATSDQAVSIENHLASTGYQSPNIGDHNETIENYTTMNSILSTVKKTLATKPKKAGRRIGKRKTTITSFASVKPANFSETSLANILLPTPRRDQTEIQNIKAHPQRSSAILRIRMKAMDEPKSAKEKAFLDTFDVGDVMQIYRKPMSEFISLLSDRYMSQLNKCRQMLCAYQIAKITDQLLRESSHKDKENLEKNLFHHLKVAITKNRCDYYRFVDLCVNSLCLVEHVGLHALFVPEVISPAILSILDTSSVVSLAKHLTDEWPPEFRKLARMTHYGKVVLSRSHIDDAIISESDGDYPGRFLNKF
ncbi:hypothetical protein MAM1_0259c08844 [Mucor ambiguus]|uniref:Uncharacterized protein n=1 Tax=Mucor ambiguus TaxID=91626 RepID=A0A0C9MPE8_9FUNG|nr:hypothetical protein MAM1_0259c08844 [Mucor ambiguus]